MTVLPRAIAFYPESDGEKLSSNSTFVATFPENTEVYSDIIFTLLKSALNIGHMDIIFTAGEKLYTDVIMDILEPFIENCNLPREYFTYKEFIYEVECVGIHVDIRRLRLLCPTLISKENKIRNCLLQLVKLYKPNQPEMNLVPLVESIFQLSNNKYEYRSNDKIFDYHQLISYTYEQRYMLFSDEFIDWVCSGNVLSVLNNNNLFVSNINDFLKNSKTHNLLSMIKQELTDTPDYYLELRKRDIFEVEYISDIDKNINEKYYNLMLTPFMIRKLTNAI